MKPSALLVEDDDAFAEMLGLLVERLGFEVNRAASVGTGKAALARRSYDVLILDFQLPDGDARDLLQYVHSRNGPVPVFIVSADREAARAMRGWPLTGLFGKPLDTRSFKHELRRLWPVVEPEGTPQPG